MRAFVVTDYAHPSKIPVTQNAPEPKAGPGQVLVDIVRRISADPDGVQ